MQNNNFLTKVFQTFTNLLPENATRTAADDPGLTIKTSPMLWPYEIFVLEWSRRTLLRDLDMMVKRDPRLDRANYVMANAATRGGITVTVDGARNGRIQKAAQDVLDKLMKECKINANLPGWSRTVIRDGDIFLNTIPEMNPDGQTARITRIKNLPAISMERADDMTDSFPDLKRAFLQIDPVTRQTIQAFPLWTVNHIRWKYEPGERYGRSQYYSGRNSWHKLQMMEEDMVVRRRTRAVQRRVHIIGNKENPGNETEVNKYKAANGLDDPKNARVTTDYFLNGIGDVKNLEGDAYLDHIADVNYFLENTFMGTGVPLHILGFGRNVNRDIVEDQKQVYKEDVQGIQDLLEHGDPGPFSGLRAIFNMALALARINPEEVSINIRWTQLDDLSFGQLVDNVIKLRAAQPKPIITHRLGLSMLSKNLDLDDEDAIDNELKAVEAELESDRNAEAIAAANVNPVKPSTTPTDRGTFAAAGRVNNDSLKPAHPLRTDKFQKLEGMTAKDLRTSFESVAQSIGSQESFVKTVRHLIGPETQIDSQEKNPDAHPLAPELLRSYVLHQFDQAWENEEDTLVNKLFSRYQESAGIAEDMVHDDIRVGVSFDLVSKEVQQYLKEQAGQRIRGIKDTTRKDLAAALDAAYSNGESVDGFMTRITDTIKAPDWRIEMIARTEMAFAFNTANLRYQRAAGYTKFRWLAVMDKRTCPKCAEKNDKVFSITDIDEPPIHPRCRCILLPDS